MDPRASTDSGFGAGMIVVILVLILIGLVLMFYVGPWIFGSTPPRSLLELPSTA